ncbi:Cordon-bleu protein-like 1 [Bagarius yarrelli]|uniref:Cordon-bleu protein-like 1 n=1 Tax=Bagarius yarrelli TaxID=175774 RepID=A0A556VBB7_BAGYA|nr:Cordon-bleu protein-like 1 [Bagarius yarrelli]
MLKPKRSDVRKAPNKPEPTVRLIINYRKSYKAVVRVSPRVPLAELMPAVCEKCEMDPESTVLLRDNQSEEPLDLTKTLNDYGIRDVYAKDCKKEKEFGEKENRGSAEKTPINNISATTASPLLKDHTINTRCSQDSEMPKKRRAPQPPSVSGYRSVSAELKSREDTTLPNTDNENRAVLSRILSTESSLKRNKRKAPPPPRTAPSLPEPTDKGSFPTIIINRIRKILCVLQ